MNGWLRWAWRVAAVASASMVVAAGACGGDDEGSGGGTSTGTATGTGTGSGTETGMGGSGTGTGTPTGEGAGNPYNCEDNNRCQFNTSSQEFCICNDCWVHESCNSTSQCVNDGVCGETEGCFCEDCSALPECQDYCVSCQEYATYYNTSQFFCPGSDAIFQTLDSCACGNTCATECGDTHCNGLSPSLDCLTCLQDNCTAEYAACLGDRVERNFCNPVTDEGCTSVANARCDWYKDAHPDLEPNIFQCALNVDADHCEACDVTAAAATGCVKTATCVDPQGQIAEQGQCAKYCCNDADCGTGTCVQGQFAASGLGVCFDGAGGGTGMIECMPPSEDPSMGSCVTVNQPD